MRTTIDLDDAWTEVARVLGTQGKTETVNRALHEVITRHRREQAVEVFRSVPLDLEEETMTQAWR